MNAKFLKADTGQDKYLSGIMQHLCIGKLQHPRQLRFYVPFLLAGAGCSHVLSSRKWFIIIQMT